MWGRKLGLALLLAWPLAGEEEGEDLLEKLAVEGGRRVISDISGGMGGWTMLGRGRGRTKISGEPWCELRGLCVRGESREG